MPHLIAIVAGGVALVFLLATLLLWHIPESPGRHWLLLFGITVFPGFALLLGVSAAIDDAKRPEFCGSCHVMQPFSRDLKDPGSPTLAATHYQNRYILEHQCYTCHTDYEWFGPLKSKLTGMRHLWNYETGHYTLPIRIRSPYRVANCLACHGEAKVYRTKHEELREQLESGAMTCLDCHGPAHPPGETRS